MTDLADMSELEKRAYNQGCLDTDKDLKEFWKQIKAKRPIERSTLRMAANQVCRHCRIILLRMAND